MESDTERTTAITDDDRKAIAAASDQTLAVWWCTLNRWEWPSNGLGEPESPKYQRRSRRGYIMDAIQARIGARACLREWNRKRMTDQEFDEWWRSRYAAIRKEDK